MYPFFRADEFMVYAYVTLQLVKLMQKRADWSYPLTALTVIAYLVTSALKMWTSLDATHEEDTE